MTPIHPKVAVPVAVSGVVTVFLAVGQVFANSTQFPVLVPIASAVVTVLTALSGYLTPGPAVQVPQVVRDVLTLFQQVADALAEVHAPAVPAKHAAAEPVTVPAPAAAVTTIAADLFPPRDISATQPEWRPVGVGNPDPAPPGGKG